jgi:hypothetical protein
LRWRADLGVVGLVGGDEGLAQVREISDWATPTAREASFTHTVGAL